MKQVIEKKRPSRLQKSAVWFITLPLCITFGNIVIAGAISTTAARQEIGTGFMLFLLAPIALLLSGVSTLVITFLPMKVGLKVVVNSSVSLMLTLPILYWVITDDGLSTIQTLKFPDHVQLVLKEDSFVDPAPCRAVYYALKTATEVREGGLGISCRTQGLIFRSIYSHNRHIIGVVERSLPTDILLLYDSQKKTFYHKGSPRYSTAIRELQQSHPTIRDDLQQKNSEYIGR